MSSNQINTVHACFSPQNMSTRWAGNWFGLFTGYILIIKKSIWNIAEAQNVFVE